MSPIRIAIAQAAPAAFNTPATLDIMDDWIDRAKDRQAALLLFPEAFIGGYPKGADFGARVGMRSEAGRDLFGRYFAGAVEREGAEIAHLRERAANAGLDVVSGLIERDGGTLYCAVVHVDAQGEIVNWRRKIMPTAMERLIWGCGDGTTLEVVETSAGRVGAAICWENYMPLLRAHFYAQNVQIYCAPTVDDRDVWQATMRHIAVEGRCFVLAAAQFARRCDYPPDYPCFQGDDPDQILIRGGSAVFDPFGECLAGPVYDQAQLLVADLDPGQIPRGKFDLDVAGHYARPDIFELRARSTRQQPER